MKLRSFLLIWILLFSPCVGYAQQAPSPNQQQQQAPQRQQAPGGQQQTPPRQPTAEELQKVMNNQIAPPAGPEIGEGYPDIITQAVILIFIALLPFLVMLLTSFMKMVISLSLLRNALGVQQTPPNQVINGIALVLTFYVMFPTGYQMYEASKSVIEEPLPTELVSGATANVALRVLDKAKEPMREFLIRNTHKPSTEGFLKIARKTFPEPVRSKLTNRDFIVVVPSYIVTQIRAAFEIGVLIYLPFFVIDIVTSNVLLAMQMMMLSPLSISLPLKLLLLVMIDGWRILLEGLVLSYK
jgi:type III secretion protein R